MEDKELIARFRAESRISALMKYCLDIVNDIRAQQCAQIEKLGESLAEYEDFVEEKSGVELDLAHLAKHAEFFDEVQFESARNRILDYAKNLRRDL